MRQFLVFLIFLYGCTSSEDSSRELLECYDKQLNKMKTESAYYEVRAQFADTAESLLSQKEYFGMPYVEKKLDDALFFNSNKDGCLLLILKKYPKGLVFGAVRVVTGQKFRGEWIFEPSIEIVFDQNYFSKYDDNSFEVLSELARVSILNEGSNTGSGCSLNEYYWFEE